MRKTVLSLTLLSICLNINSQIQISNFTYNNVQYSEPISLQKFNNKIFFSAVTDGYGRELWSSDGTSTSTNLFKEFANGPTDGIRNFYSTILNDELYFNTNDDSSYSGGEIWKTNGLATTLVVSYSGRLFGLTTVGNQIYMTLGTSDTTLQVWKTDGTSSGTILVKDNIALWNYPSFQGALNDKFIFTIQVPSTGKSRVWRSDGTVMGTYELTEELDGNGSGDSGTSVLSHYIKYNNKLYFITRYFLYETDGTTTNQVASVWNAQNDLVNFGDAIVLNNKMYFSFFSMDLNKLSIYESNGTLSGTSEIFNVTSSEYFYPSYFSLSNNNLIFSSVNSDNGTSLFYLDSVTNDISEIIEIEENPQAPGFFSPVYTALSITSIDGNNFFLNSPKDIWAQQRKGWIFNKTDSSLKPMADLDNISNRNGYKVIYKNNLYYSKDYQLWKFDTNSLKIDSVNKIKDIQFFPNPASEFIYFNKSSHISRINIYDLNGKLVLNVDMSVGSKIDIKDLNSGFYIIKILKKNGGITNRKLLKK